MRHRHVSTHSFSNSLLRHHCAFVISSVYQHLWSPCSTFILSPEHHKSSMYRADFQWDEDVYSQLLSSFSIHCTILFVAPVPQPSYRLPCFCIFPVSSITFETPFAPQNCQIIGLVLPAVSPMFRTGHATPFQTRVHRLLDSSDFMTVAHGEFSVYPFFGVSAVSAHLQSGTFTSCPNFSGGPTFLGSLF